MKLKHNLIAGAALAFVSAASFAATAPTCPTTIASAADAATFVANCTPEQTLFIGGASTMKGKAASLLNSRIFDTATIAPIKVNDKGSVSGLNGNVIAFYGMSKAALTGGASKRLLVVYNYNNGSAAGVSQLWAKPDAVAVPESDVVTVGAVKNVASACTINATPGAGTTASPYSVDCTSHGVKQADIALSDVNAAELYAVYAAAAKGKVKDLTPTPLLLQSFGVVASPLMYSALQAQNIADGKLAASCAGDLTAACQPSIRSADYASLVSKVGSIKSLAALVPAAGVSNVLTLARRDNLSGSQASSNIFFVNGQCGGNEKQADTKSLDAKLIKAGALMGGLDIISADDAASYPGLNILSAVVSGDVKNAVSSTTDYAIGVLNVGGGGVVTGTGGGNGRFVKIDGISPNFTVAGVADSLTPLRSGDYPFAMTTYALTVTKAMVKDAEKKALTDALIAGFQDSTLAQSGLAYFDGVDATKQALAKRKNGNNCSPLVKM